MELNKKYLETGWFWFLEDEVNATYVSMDKDELIETYNLIQEELKKIGVLV